MKIFVCGMLVATLTMTVGCGGSSIAEKTTAKKTSSNKQRKSSSPSEPSPPPAPPPKPKIVVPQDAYSGVPQALQAYTDALKTQNAGEADRVEAWLEMNGEQSVKGLAEILKDSSTSPETQVAASRALGRSGPTAAKALMEVIATTKVDQVRLKSIESISILKPANPDTIKMLHGLMTHKDSRVRQSAIQGLARIGAPAKDVVPDLMNVLNNTKENDTVRSAAKDALKKIDPRKGFHGMKLD
jgi:HEAT repeat protein